MIQHPPSGPRRGSPRHPPAPRRRMHPARQRVRPRTHRRRTSPRRPRPPPRWRGGPVRGPGATSPAGCACAASTPRPRARPRSRPSSPPHPSSAPTRESRAGARRPRRPPRGTRRVEAPRHRRFDGKRDGRGGGPRRTTRRRRGACHPLPRRAEASFRPWQAPSLPDPSRAYRCRLRRAFRCGAAAWGVPEEKRRVLLRLKTTIRM